MAMDNWSRNEYRTFITSRRDGVFEKREDSVFSFKRPASVEVARNDYCEKEVFFDTDVNLPPQWESMVRVALKKSSGKFEFKSAPVSPVIPTVSPADEVFKLPSYGSQQPAEHHKQSSSVKKQVEDDGHGRKDHAFVVSQRNAAAMSITQMSPGSLTRMFQPKYSKSCANSVDVVAAADTITMDSRSSSFRSQSSSNICESGDRDTGGECSTSRDSNGSSQDASTMSNDTFDSERMMNAAEVLKTKSKGHHHHHHNTTTNHHQENEKTSTSTSSWLRSPLKWKGIFGGNKKSANPDAKGDNHPHPHPRPSSKLSEVSCSSTYSSRTDIRHSYSEHPPRPAAAVSRATTRQSSSEYNKTPANSIRPHPPLLPHHHSTIGDVPKLGTTKADNNNNNNNIAGYINGTKVKTSSLKLKSEQSYPSTADCSDVHSVVSIERDRDQGGIARVRERWNKYMKILKISNTRDASNKKGSDAGIGSDQSSAAPSRTSTLPNQQTTSSGAAPPRAKSMPAILKTPPLRPKSGPSSVFQPVTPTSNSRPPLPNNGGASHGGKSSNNLLPHSGGLVTSSPRLMKSSSPKLISLSPKVKSSPKVSSSNNSSTISPRISSSSMSELHSAVQGAIAHCKQSHSGLLSPAACKV